MLNPNWFATFLTPEVLALGLLVVFLLGIYAGWLLLRYLRRFEGDRFRHQGLMAEEDALAILEEMGFCLQKRNPSFQSVLLVNGEKHLFTIQPDLLVEKDGISYCVEVKSHGKGIRTALVRRQVLEYLVATGQPCLLITLPEGYVEMVEMVTEPE